MDEIDRALIVATQGGLPLVARPYHTIGEQIGIAGEEVMRRMQALLNGGIIRRIGAVPNHYAIGWTANGMTVWDVADDKVDELGPLVGALPFVTHSYRRPRALPAWPYNLFAMVHGSSREECSAKALEIRALLGDACRANDILYSTRILKKTGLRIGA
ncbi:MAG: AsnC family transcriptional regulator [Betaproteobacteria bacterium]|jgi:DNA-binding Lrp family transcriptional regulator|nr:AsnC family transcriptional regulator [Candidatus Dechloromonas phosphorivorans]